MKERVLREALAVGLLLFAVLLAVALVSHSPLDPSPFHVSTLRSSPHNLAGWLGSTLSAALLDLVGLAAVLVPVLAGVAGWRLLREASIRNLRYKVAGWALLFVAIPGFANLLRQDVGVRGGVVSCGGLIGRAVDELLVAVAGAAGRLTILVFLLVVGVLLVSGASAAAGVDRLAKRMRGRAETRRRERFERQRENEKRRTQQRVLERQLTRLEQGETPPSSSVTVKELNGRGRFRIIRRVVGEEGAALEPEPSGSAFAASSAKRPAARRERGQTPAAPKGPVVQEEFDFIEELAEYDLPKVSFLDPADEAAARDSSALIEIGRMISDKCREFRVSGEVVNIRTGPVITTYEFRLDSGVKISAIQNLAEDLALALRTESVRIERVPGRATVGIEVPNPSPEVIRLGQLIDTDEFRRLPSLLTLSLGVDIHGRPFFADLQRMPHLLLGGFTGSGKSVGLNAMIMSILFKARPDEVKFILVDPKMVELGVYSDIPHLLTPIIIDPKKAANALGWAVAEMDGRYRVLASLGVRNLAQYNRLVRDPAQVARVRNHLRREEGEEEPVLEPMPYVVIVIDELADLMLTSSRAVEESITRLAQKARAVGIHLICATQRPSVDILTGIIKANFTCRIAFKVRSKFDSRTILDAVGAEHLLGRGDMLFLPSGSSALQRLHGPLVTEKEIATVVRYIKRFGKPEYQRDVLSHPALGEGEKGRRSASASEAEDLTDPMYDKAARLVISTRKASASFIQRRLHLGYTRSARLIDMMESEGLVGPLNGAKGREVLVPQDYFEEVDETHDPDEIDDI
ncbi:MAG: DNA translocase FtsK 4TM domain-containing protein [Acidobacteria bacterium]|nr:DNA translocase FtsK 4TM domain-containing protein [Acidobacteriota bacterium]